MLLDGIELLLMNLFMVGNNLWQIGSQVLFFVLSSQGVEIFEGINFDEEWQWLNVVFLDCIYVNIESLFVLQFVIMVDCICMIGGLVNGVLVLGFELLIVFLVICFVE